MIAIPTARPPASLRRYALDADSAAVRAIAGAVESAWLRGLSAGYGLRGLPESEWRALLAHYFPASCSAALPPFVPMARDAEFDDVNELLLESARDRSRESRWLASAVASAAMFDDHLWQDLRLDNRAMLSSLLHTYFGELARRNTGNMRWKAFFYKQICERAGQVCRAPSCGACSDYAECFGPEDADETGSPVAGAVSFST